MLYEGNLIPIYYKASYLFYEYQSYCLYIFCTMKGKVLLLIIPK